MTEQKVFILFGEALDTNVNDLNKLLEDGWRVINVCPMPSATAIAQRNTPGADLAGRWFEPQCAIIIEKYIK